MLAYTFVSLLLPLASLASVSTCDSSATPIRMSNVLNVLNSLKSVGGPDSAGQCDRVLTAKEDACMDMDVAHDVMSDFVEEFIDYEVSILILTLSSD
jgi:hypothetical protein